MKIEQLFVQHLYKSKELTLQGIGTFRLNPQVTIPLADDKDFHMPANAIQFEFNLKSAEDEALIDYIVKHTRKMKPLATSDLESYVMLAKQFLNIGKPLVIEGIGTVYKTNSGEYEFLQGSFVVQKNEEAPNPLKEKNEEAVSFRTEPNHHRRRTLSIPFPLIILFILLAGLIAFYFIRKHHEPAGNPTLPAQSATDIVVKKDTVKNKIADSGLLKPVPVVKDSFNFRIIIKEYSDSGTANRAFKKLMVTKYGNRVRLYQTDSTYKIGIPFTTPVSDTAIELDSIHKFFLGNTRVEL